MKQKMLLFVCALVMIFSQIACTPADRNIVESVSDSSTASATDPAEKPHRENLSTPYFWKVTGNGYDGDFYLLGSIHVGNQYTNLYPDEIINAFKECEHLAVESDIVALEKNFDMQIEMTRILMYADGSSITSHINPDLYAAARKIIEDGGQYNQAFDKLRPVYWMSMIENIYLTETAYTANYGVDRYFLNAAHLKKKTILEIEDPMDTYQALVDLSPKTQEYLLSQCIQPGYPEEYAASINLLYPLWKKGDITGYEHLLCGTSTEGMTDMTEEEIAIYEEYNDMMLTTRNAGMVDAAIDYMESDMDVFYIVGLAHMFGDDGLVHALTEAGYTVTRVQYDLD